MYDKEVLKEITMETINHSDYAALDIIAMVIKQLKTDDNPSVGDYTWALDMIEHEVTQTGRRL